jgi:hypothetical protein
MTKSEVKELINYLKTKLGGDVTKRQENFDGPFLEGRWFTFDESTDDHELEINIDWFPKDPKDLEEIKDEE